MKSGPSPRPSIQKLAPYLPGRPIEEVEAEYGIHGAVKLASNENPLGPSPKALAAAQAALVDVHRYPDGSATSLRKALGVRLGVATDQVLVGSGASELIDLAIRTFVDPGEEVVMPAGIFRMFPLAVDRAGGTREEVPTREDHRPDLGAMALRVGGRTQAVAIANPNNPTGAYVPREELRRFVERLPPHVLVILDEAYFEFAYGVVPDYPNGLELLADGRPVLVLRTFSKIAGLAGLRIGYGVGPAEVVAAIHKVREPFNTTSVAQAAALAALGDEEHRRRVRELVLSERAFLGEELARRGLPPVPSVANFFLVPLPIPFAPLEKEFARRGVILRPMGSWGFPNAFRVSVGAHVENVRFLAVLDEIVLAGLLPVARPAAAAVSLR